MLWFSLTFIVSRREWPVKCCQYPLGKDILSIEFCQRFGLRAVRPSLSTSLIHHQKPN